MKAIAYEIIDGFSIVKSICSPTVDPELSKQEARKRLEKSEVYRAFERAYRVCSGLADATPEEISTARDQLLAMADDILELRESLAQESRVYFPVPGEANVLDSHAEQLREALAKLGDHELLTLDGRIVRDERGRRAWKLEDSGRWDYATIAKLGAKLPEGYQWSEDLSPVELAAIREQMDRERIEAMSFDERRARAEGEADAVLDGLVRQHLRAQIKGGEGSGHEALRALYEQALVQIYERYNLLGDTTTTSSTSEVADERREEESPGENDGGDGRADPQEGAG